MVRTTGKILHRLAIELVLPLALFVLLLAVSANSTNFYFPPLARVLERFDALWLGPRFVTDVLPSLGRLIAGYAIACLAGVVIGVPLGMFAALRRAVASRCWSSFGRSRRRYWFRCSCCSPVSATP